MPLREVGCGRLREGLWSGHARAAPAARDGGRGGGRGATSDAPSPPLLVLLPALVLPCAFSSSDSGKKMPRPAVGPPTCGHQRRAAWATSSGVHNAHAPYPRAQRACNQQVVERDVVPEPGVLAGETAKRLPPCWMKSLFMFSKTICWNGVWTTVPALQRRALARGAVLLTKPDLRTQLGGVP
jgi:hypothetical protein